jgi:hypothetical protein
MTTEADGQTDGPCGGAREGACAPQGAAASRLSCAVFGESGTATVEFCMVLPIVLFLGLVLVQSTLLMVGNQFVNYAAFAAARSAIVYIPQDYSATGEPRNTIIAQEGKPKFDAIRAAAYLAVTPVCGKREDSVEALNTDQFVAGLNDYFAGYGQDSPRWVQTLAAARLRYAAANTDVRVMYTLVTRGEVEQFDTEPEGYYTFGPHEAVTVRIEHKLNLSVPYVRRLFADGEHGGDRGSYALVTAQYTLTNEGIDPDLPGPPELERITD